MVSHMVLLLMVILLAMVLVVRLVLIFLAHTHLHVSLVWCPIHHHVLPLHVGLIVGGVGIVRASLRDRRARG